MKAIVHVDDMWGIGKDNSLMFKLPADMMFFKEKTLGNVVCMGYNTLLSLPGSKPLKGRKNIVLCPEDTVRDDCFTVHSVDELLNKVKCETKDVFVIGGAGTYKSLLPYCDEVYVTKVKARGGADAFFPNLDEDENFSLVYTSEECETNGYYITFNTYKNKAVLNF